MTKERYVEIYFEKNLMKIQKRIDGRWFRSLRICRRIERNVLKQNYKRFWYSAFTTPERYIKVWIYFTFMRTLEREWVEILKLTYMCNFLDTQPHLYRIKQDFPKILQFYVEWNIKFYGTFYVLHFSHQREAIIVMYHIGN